MRISRAAFLVVIWPGATGWAATAPMAVARGGEAALTAPIETVVRKETPAPSGDAHEYVSFERPAWTDAHASGGWPFIRRGGRANETQARLGDELRLEQMVIAVRALTEEWTQSHREAAARRAGEWLRAWFLAPATRMNPDLDYARIRLGHDHDRGTPEGILDGRVLMSVVADLRILSSSPAISSAEDDEIRGWFATYLTWLVHSRNGRAEHAAMNDQGSWYLAQAIAVARFVGELDLARQFCLEDRDLVDRQIDADGRQPLELARDDGLGYSVFNLEAQAAIAGEAERMGLDLWNYAGKRGGSLPKALAYLEPYDREPGRWPGHEIRKLDPGFLDPLLAAGAALARRPPAPAQAASVQVTSP